MSYFRPHFLITATLLIATFIYLNFATGVHPVPLKRPLSNFPSRIGQWTQISEQMMDTRTLKVLGVDDYFTRTYTRGNGSSISLYVGYFTDQEEGEMAHSPKHCLPGGGWHPIESGTYTITIPDNKRKVTVNKYILSKGDTKQLFTYWYHSRGRVVASEYTDRIYMILDSIFKKRSDGALVRVSSLMFNKEDAMRQHTEFIRALFPHLKEFLPD